MSDQKLKPCPFCGSDATMYRGRYSDDGKRDEPWAVSCDECDARVYLIPEYGEGNYWWRHTTEGETHMREAITNKWNSRNDKTGHLNSSNPPTRGWYCSECHVYISDETMADATTWLKPRHCPNCGTKFE